ncbi:MAG: Na+/H+ antiporter NhaA [Hyphomicrobiaceae bacterium]|nr:Na+/H+ antiporter NhaA [Hyphomicrobiaceae bacterium]
MNEALKKFLSLESASGIFLVIAMILALIAENSFLQASYDALLQTRVEVRIGKLHLAKPLLLWVNDALMAVFFLLVGLELKREMLIGQLSSPAQIFLPAIAAIGGIVAPALIYVYFNQDDAMALKGWAIPAATDIAFALGVLALLGSRVPPALKLFLLALAIIDDIGAIIIIAIFYSGDLSIDSLIVAGAALVALAFLNWRNSMSIALYLTVGLVLWVAVLKSGVHATLAGIILAFFIPLRGHEDPEQSPLARLEHDLHPSVAFIILPVFAFANAGISLQGLSFSTLLEPVPLGIALGLIVGKQIGIFGMVWLAVKSGLARLPEGMGWLHLYGVSVLCGIGFTMSLFISSLAFEQGAIAYATNDRLGILVGSLVSALAGYFLLRSATRNE